jgi:hypothetical protein
VGHPRHPQEFLAVPVAIGPRAGAVLAGGDADAPPLDLPGVVDVQIPRDELREVAVARRRERPEAVVEIEGDLVAVDEVGGVVEVADGPVREGLAGFEFGLEQFEQVPAVPACAREPGEVVHPAHVDAHLVAVGVDAPALGGQRGEIVLGAVHLVADAHRVDRGVLLVQRPGADGHRVREVEHPGVGTLLADGGRHLAVLGDRSHRAQTAAGTDRVADGLVDAVFGG